MTTPSRLRDRILTLAAFVAAGIASPGWAASEPVTRLVDCRSESCLLVTGYRDDATAPVSINGHVVPVEGTRKWRVRLPVETLRTWSAPYARTITVSVANRGARNDAAADLPIGLLGHVTDLAFLTVSVK